MFFYLWPTWLIIVSEIVVVTGVAVGGHMIVRGISFRIAFSKSTTMCRASVLAIVGVIYAVLLAFVVVIAWESFNAAESTAQTEVSAASDLYRLSSTFHDPQRKALRDELLRYAELVRDQEWPAIRSTAPNRRRRTIATSGSATSL